MQRPVKFREMEAVVLERNIPERGLRKGDLRAVVELNVRGVRDEDLVSVRSVALGAKAMVPRDSDGDESQK